MVRSKQYLIIAKDLHRYIEDKRKENMRMQFFNLNFYSSFNVSTQVSLKYRSDANWNRYDFNSV